MIPTLTTDRLFLRAPETADFDALCAYFRDPRSAFNGGPKEPVDVWTMLTSALGQWHLRGHGLWFAHLRDTDALVGFAGVFHPFDWPEPELGYGVIAEAEGKGIAFEAVTAARAGAARLGLTRLPSFIAPDNARSQALATRLGASFETEITLRDKPAQVWRHPEVRP